MTFNQAEHDVLLERFRQKDVEGWTPEHDDKYQANELVRAAICYTEVGFKTLLNLWPWDEKWFKPTNRRRDLVKAAALLIAEIERLDRLPK